MGGWGHPFLFHTSPHLAFYLCMEEGTPLPFLCHRPGLQNIKGVGTQGPQAKTTHSDFFLLSSQVGWAFPMFLTLDPSVPEVLS